MPQGNCALGVGTYQNGYASVPVNWSGNTDCTRLTLNPVSGVVQLRDRNGPTLRR
ncbi:hypothetical protein [Streptomyces sp. NPDC050485]|uniref:hypothetical protein n=1 Tax=Streptomyces sp. NPDC050485 TaxID=3365617 RepID=UPI00379310C2